MRKILTFVIVILGLTGCMGRKVVINPDEMSRFNDVDWHVINASSIDIPNHSPEKNLKQRGRVEREWELGE